MNAKEKMKYIINKILETLADLFRVDANEFLAYKVALETKDPYETLIATILTQNTNERNAFNSYYSLKQKYLIKPNVLARLNINELAKIIRFGGLNEIKAKRIIESSKHILEKYNGNLWKILELPLNEAREKLMKIPGVGPKTADIILLMIANKPTIPIDTHIMRVSYRLGFSRKRDYEETRRTLMNLLNPKDYLKAHLFLILLGKKFCKARNPRCKSCPVNNYCAKVLTK